MIPITIMSSFDQNTAEFYDHQILLTAICIFWLNFRLKPRYFALHLTEKYFKISPPPLDTRSPSLCSFKKCNLHCQYDLISKGETIFLRNFRFPLDEIQNSIGFNPNLGQNIQSTVTRMCLS